MKKLNKSMNLLRLILMVMVVVMSPRLWAQDKPTDEAITQAIETELLVQRGVYSHLIDVEFNNGVVTLNGTVDNILEKERSAEVAKSVKGVEAVVNQITVKTPKIEDSTLKQNIEHALLNDPATDSYEVTVTVNNGVVTLEGTVQSWQEKQLAAKVSKGIAGVKKLNNKIEFEYVSRPDYEIQKDIEQVLQWDVYVGDKLIKVNVKKGEVKLSGIVGSAAEKSLAELDSWVSGVKVVNTEELIVEPWADNKLKKDQKVSFKTDAEIKQAVEKAFLYDPRVLSFNPKVEVKYGIVTLTGKVNNLNAKRAAGEDAQNVVGVIQVNNLLKVRLIESFYDEAVRRNVIWAIKVDPYVERFDVDVRVNNGVAYLSGEVDNYFEKLQADDAASKAKGVIAVVNNLKISQVPEVVRPSYRSSNYWHFWNTRADWVIKEAIESQLWWSPFVDENEVNVSVDNGHVKLTGTVDSWRERLAAEENAFEGGALSVNNQLKIENNPYY